MRSTFNKICCSNDDDLIQPLKLSINEQVNKIVQLSEEKKQLEKINKNLNSEINKLKASNENNGTFSPPTLPSSSRKYYNATKSNQNDTDETHSEENVQSNEIDDKNINETIAEDNNAYEIQINNNNENITETKSIDDETHTEDNDEKEIETNTYNNEKESKDNEIETNTYNNEEESKDSEIKTITYNNEEENNKNKTHSEETENKTPNKIRMENYDIVDISSPPSIHYSHNNSDRFSLFIRNANRLDQIITATKKNLQIHEEYTDSPLIPIPNNNLERTTTTNVIYEQSPDLFDSHILQIETLLNEIKKLKEEKNLLKTKYKAQIGHHVSFDQRFLHPPKKVYSWEEFSQEDLNAANSINEEIKEENDNNNNSNNEDTFEEYQPKKIKENTGIALTKNLRNFSFHSLDDSPSPFSNLLSGHIFDNKTNDLMISPTINFEISLKTNNFTLINNNENINIEPTDNEIINNETINNNDNENINIKLNNKDNENISIDNNNSETYSDSFNENLNFNVNNNEIINCNEIISLKTNLNEIKNKYSQIENNFNDLFHRHKEIVEILIKNYLTAMSLINGDEIHAETLIAKMQEQSAYITSLIMEREELYSKLNKLQNNSANDINNQIKSDLMSFNQTRINSLQYELNQFTIENNELHKEIDKLNETLFKNNDMQNELKNKLEKSNLEIEKLHNELILIQKNSEFEFELIEPFIIFSINSNPKPKNILTLSAPIEKIVKVSKINPKTSLKPLNNNTIKRKISFPIQNTSEIKPFSNIQNLKNRILSLERLLDIKSTQLIDINNSYNEQQQILFKQNVKIQKMEREIQRFTLISELSNKKIQSAAEMITFLAKENENLKNLIDKSKDPKEDKNKEKGLSSANTKNLISDLEMIGNINNNKMKQMTLRHMLSMAKWEERKMDLLNQEKEKSFASLKALNLVINETENNEKEQQKNPLEIISEEKNNEKKENQKQIIHYNKNLKKNEKKLTPTFEEATLRANAHEQKLPKILKNGIVATPIKT